MVINENTTLYPSGGVLSTQGSLDRCSFSILTTFLSVSRAKFLPSLIQVFLTALYFADPLQPSFVQQGQVLNSHNAQSLQVPVCLGDFSAAALP